MQIEPDYEALVRRERHRVGGPPRRPAWQWVLIIATGVLLANLISGIALKAYLIWEAEQAMKVIDQQMEQWRQQSERAVQENAARTAEQAERARQQAAAQQRTAQQKQAAIRQARETCDYWRQQVAQSNTEYNRLMQKTACAELMRALR